MEWGLGRVLEWSNRSSMDRFILSMKSFHRELELNPAEFQLGDRLFFLNKIDNPSIFIN